MPGPNPSTSAFRGGRRSPSPSAVHSHKQRETLTNSKEFTTNSVVSMRVAARSRLEGVARAERPIARSSRSFPAGRESARRNKSSASLLSARKNRGGKSSSRTGCWYFYSRLQSLLACGLFAPVPSLSGARGLHQELYIQPRPPPHFCAASRRVA